MKEMKEKRRMEKKNRSGSDSKESSSPRHKSHGRKDDSENENLQKMEELLNGMVTKLVDQRIKHLLPCLKENILRGD